MKIQVKKITPEFATRVLTTKNTNNRPLNEATVKLYCNDMRRGNWGVSHQGIAFDEDGNLLDGQHRLAAIQMLGSPIDMTVATGLPSTQQMNGHAINTMDMIDRGKLRSIAQQLQMAHGVTNANLVVAICAVLRSVCKSEGTRMTTAQALACIDIYRKEIDAVVHRNYLKGDKKAAILGILVMFHAAFPDEEEQFSQQLITNEGLKPKSPVNALRKWLINHANSSNGTVDRRELPFIVASSVMRFHDKQPAETLRFTAEPMRRLKEAQQVRVRKIIDVFS